jgi:hypothetical protein
MTIEHFTRDLRVARLIGSGQAKSTEAIEKEKTTEHG